MFWSLWKSICGRQWVMCFVHSNIRLQSLENTSPHKAEQQKASDLRIDYFETQLVFHEKINIPSYRRVGPIIAGQEITSPQKHGRFVFRSMKISCKLWVISILDKLLRNKKNTSCFEESAQCTWWNIPKKPKNSAKVTNKTRLPFPSKWWQNKQRIWVVPGL